MAYQTRLTNWLLSHKEILKPQFTMFDWPERYCVGLHDLETKLTLGQMTVEGRGLANIPEIAIEKSISEAIERLICRELAISSVGVAVNGETSAIEHATFEFYERYFLDLHMRKKLPLIEINFQRKGIEETFYKVLDSFAHLNPKATLKFYSMLTSAPYTGLVCRIMEDEGQPIFGFAFDKLKPTAIARSFYEAISNFAYLKDSKADFNSSVSSKKDLWHLRADFTNKLSELLVPHSESIPIQNLPEFEIQRLDISSIPDLEGCPVDPVRVFAKRGTE